MTFLKREKQAKQPSTAANLKLQYLENDPVFAKQKGYNPFLISKIQPMGNLRFDDDKFIKAGADYIACLHVTELPNEVSDFWLQDLVDLKDALTVIDIGNNDMEETKDKIDRSVSELESRKSKSSEQDLDTLHKHDLLVSIQKDIIENHEIIKELNIRLFVFGHTRDETEKKIEKVKTDLVSMGFQSEVFLNEQEYEYKAITQPMSRQVNNANHRKGLSVSSYSLGLSWLFNNEDLLDPHGDYIGVTGRYGKVFFDQFHKTPGRQSYDAVLFGKKGSGKSTLIKLLMKYRALRGDYVRVLDCTGEFSEIAQLLGGTVVTMDGSSGRLNCMEIFPGADNASSTFALHLSKLNTIYKLAAPNSTDNERNEFEEFARDLYREMGVYDTASNRTDWQLTGLSPAAYPSLGDLLRFVQRSLYTDTDRRIVSGDLSPSRRERLESIELTLRNLVKSYPSIFDGKTTLQDLTAQHIVVYNVQNVGEMREEVFQALLFNILNLMLSDMIRIGGKSKEMYESGAVPAYLVPKLELIVDESHRFINTKNELVLDYLIKIVREDRKFFTALVCASQSIRDFVPEGNAGAGIEKLKTLFEMMQYKFIMQQDDNALALLNNVFGESVTQSQLSIIPKFKTGETILLTGEQNLHMSVYASQRDLQRFKGGA